MFRSPHFWSKRQWISYFLIPFSWIWTSISKWHESRIKPEQVSVPVVCVGNLVMGGAGKTPTVIALVDLLKKMGHVPHILSRGYGAYIRNTIQVNPNKHNYLQVGDEPLLLALAAPTWAGPDRVLSAKTAISKGATILVMDDGLQNPSLKKDLSFIVVDSIQGIGNGMVFPAGPLRESIESGADRAHAMIVIGNGNTSFKFINQQFSAKITCVENNFSESQTKRVVAFAGIGCPEKFNHTLNENNFEISQFVEFADHHPYTIHDMIRLIKIADQYESTLITTSKDWLRIPNNYRDVVKFLPIILSFDEPEKIQSFLKKIIDTGHSLENSLQITTTL